jgi:hypothetical protein
VRIAKADLIPTDVNLLPDYASFADLEAAGEEFIATTNARPHRLLGRPPSDGLVEERARLHLVPAPYVAILGQTRTVCQAPGTPVRMDPRQAEKAGSYSNLADLRDRIRKLVTVWP